MTNKLKELEEQNAHLREQNIYCNHQVVTNNIIFFIITPIIITIIIITMITKHLLQPPGGHQRHQHHCDHYHHPQMELLRVRLAQLQELGQTTASRRESVAEVIKS